MKDSVAASRAAQRVCGRNVIRWRWIEVDEANASTELTERSASNTALWKSRSLVFITLSDLGLLRERQCSILEGLLRRLMV